MRYIIIGAGAVGGTIGGRLFDNGHEVVLVARGPHLGALRAHGLRLATPDGTSTLPIPAVGRPGELQLEHGDVLVLAVKTQDTAAVLAEWAWQPVRGGTVAAESLPVVCAPNGVASERIASQEESAEVRGDRVRILPINGSPRGGGSSWQSLTRGTGSIEADFLNGEIVLLGREHGVPAPVNEVLQRLANQAARERQAPGSIAPGEVMALLAA
jgi:ketopantoate reductase